MKRRGDKGSPCFKPTALSINSERFELLDTLIHDFTLLYRDLIMRISLQLNPEVASFCIKKSRLLVSKHFS